MGNKEYSYAASIVISIRSWDAIDAMETSEEVREHIEYTYNAKNAEELRDSDRERIEAIVQEELNRVLSKRKATCNFCSSPDAVEHHAKAHEFLDKLMATLDRLENIKWGILKSVLQVITISLLGLIGALLWKQIKG